MPKFQAMMDMLYLTIPFIERDEKGQLLRDQTITFNPGIKIGKSKVVPASVSIPDKDTATLKYMRDYAGNKANGGTSFEEISEKKSESVKAAKAEPKAKSPEPTKDEEEDENDVDKTENTDHPEVTTVQAAGNLLKGLFSELTSRDVNNKDKVLAVAASKNISFSNLN